jgi:hypothetical protein
VTAFDLGDHFAGAVPDPPRWIVKDDESARRHGVMTLLHVGEQVLAGVMSPSVRLVNDR